MKPEMQDLIKFAKRILKESQELNNHKLEEIRKLVWKTELKDSEILEKLRSKL